MISSISFRFKHFLESISPYSQRSIFQDWNYLSLYALKDSRVRLEFVMISIESSKNFLNQIIEGKEIRCLNFLSQLSLSSIRVNHELNWDEKTKDESWYDRSILSKSIWGICAYYCILLSKWHKQAVMRQGFQGSKHLPMTPDHQTKTVGFWFSHFFNLSYALI